MSLHDFPDTHKVHVREPTRFSVSFVHSVLKRSILFAYERRLINIGTTRRIINALRLQGA